MFFSCEQEKLLKIEDYLQKYVVGQDQAIFAVTNAIRRARAGLQDIDRPLEPDFKRLTISAPPDLVLSTMESILSREIAQECLLGKLIFF